MLVADEWVGFATVRKSTSFQIVLPCPTLIHVSNDCLHRTVLRIGIFSHTYLKVRLKIGNAKLQAALRVSAPQGIQRSSYFLSMPFRYSIPMLAIFSVMHWLLSQATFIIRVNRITWEGEPDFGWTTGGYSLFPGLMGESTFEKDMDSGTIVYLLI